MSYHHALARNHISKTRGQWLNSHTFDGHNCPREPDDQNYFEVIVQKLKIVREVFSTWDGIHDKLSHFPTPWCRFPEMIESPAK